MIPVGRRTVRRVVVQAAHQHFDAAVEHAEDVVLRHFHVIEEQLAGVGAAHAELVELVTAAEAFPVALDDERRDAVGAFLQVGLGVDHVGAGVGAVGDPGLAAVEHVVVAALVGAQFHRDHVGAGIRLAHGQGADVFAADQLRQVLEFLFMAAVAVDLVHAEVGVGAVGQRHRCRTTADLFHSHHMGQVAQAGTAVFFGHGNAQQAHVTELAPQVGGEQVVDVDLCRARRNLLGHEGLHLVAQHVDGFAEGEVQGGVTHGQAPLLSFGCCGVTAPGRGCSPLR